MADLPESTGSEGRANTPLTSESSPLVPHIRRPIRKTGWQAKAAGVGLAVAGALGLSRNPGEDVAALERHRAYLAIGLSGVDLNHKTLPTAPATDAPAPSATPGTPGGDPPTPPPATTGVPSVEPTARPTEKLPNQERVLDTSTVLYSNAGDIEPIYSFPEGDDNQRKAIITGRYEKKGKTFFAATMGGASCVFDSAQQPDIDPLTVGEIPIPDYAVTRTLVYEDTPLTVKGGELRPLSMRDRIAPGQAFAVRSKGRASTIEGSSESSLEETSGFTFGTLNSPDGHFLYIKTKSGEEYKLPLIDTSGQAGGVTTLGADVFFDTRIKVSYLDDGRMQLTPFKVDGDAETQYVDRYGVPIQAVLPGDQISDGRVFGRLKASDGASLTTYAAELKKGFVLDEVDRDALRPELNSGATVNKMTGVRLGLLSPYILKDRAFFEAGGAQSVYSDVSLNYRALLSDGDDAQLEITRWKEYARTLAAYGVKMHHSLYTNGTQLSDGITAEQYVRYVNNVARLRGTNTTILVDSFVVNRRGQVGLNLCKACKIGSPTSDKDALLGLIRRMNGVGSTGLKLEIPNPNTARNIEGLGYFGELVAATSGKKILMDTKSLSPGELRALFATIGEYGATAVKAAIGGHDYDTMITEFSEYHKLGMDDLFVPVKPSDNDNFESLAAEDVDTGNMSLRFASQTGVPVGGSPLARFYRVMGLK